MLEKFKRILTIMMFVELGLLVLLGVLTAWWVPLVEVFVSFLCAVFVGRRYGFSVRRDPGSQVSVFDATVGTLAAVLLALPGLLTDLLGLILWFGPTRKSMGKRAVRWAEQRSGHAFGAHGFATNEGPPIEAEVVDVRTVSED